MGILKKINLLDSAVLQFVAYDGKNAPSLIPVSRLTELFVPSHKNYFLKQDNLSYVADYCVK